jgi:hypothetical protein
MATVPRFEVVTPTTREGDGYFCSYSEAVEFGLTAGAPFEVWQVADDASRTRVVRLYPQPKPGERLNESTGLVEYSAAWL